ncbi:MAG: hypothetical protein WDO73_27800 [Ignavibacteriota bacterium]
MKTSADVLEFESLRQLLRRYMSSEPGKRELDKLEPHSDRATPRRRLRRGGRGHGVPAYCRESADRRTRFGDPGGFQRTARYRKSRSQAAHRRGGPRSQRDFRHFALLDRAADAKSSLTATAERFPRLGRRAQTIGDFRALLKDLEGKILPDGSIADHASVALNRIRRDIERQKRSIQESLERFLRSHRDEGVLQEEFVTIRNERFVVPIIAGQRRKLDGVIHGASASGATLFVEPIETIDSTTNWSASPKRKCGSAPHPGGNHQPPARLRATPSGRR